MAGSQVACSRLMAATQKVCVGFLGAGVHCRSTATIHAGVPQLIMPGRRSPSYGQLLSRGVRLWIAQAKAAIEQAQALGAQVHCQFEGQV